MFLESDGEKYKEDIALIIFDYNTKSITLLTKSKLGLISKYLEMEDRELNYNTEICYVQFYVMHCKNPNNIEPLVRIASDTDCGSPNVYTNHLTTFMEILLIMNHGKLNLVPPSYRQF